MCEQPGSMYHDRRISDPGPTNQHPTAPRSPASAQTAYGYQQQNSTTSYGSSGEAQQPVWGGYPATQYTRQPGAHGSHVYVSSVDSSGISQTAGVGNTNMMDQRAQTTAGVSPVMGTPITSMIGTGYHIAQQIQAQQQRQQQQQQQQRHHYYPNASTPAQAPVHTVTATSAPEYRPPLTSTGHYKASPPQRIAQPISHQHQQQNQQQQQQYHHATDAPQARTGTSTQPVVLSTSSHVSGSFQASERPQVPQQSMYNQRHSPIVSQTPPPKPVHPAPTAPTSVEKTYNTATNVTESESRFDATEIARRVLEREAHHMAMKAMQEQATSESAHRDFESRVAPPRPEPQPTASTHQECRHHPPPQPQPRLQSQSQSQTQPLQHPPRRSDPTPSAPVYNPPALYQPEPSQQYVQLQNIYNPPPPRIQREPTPPKEAEPEEQPDQPQIPELEPPAAPKLDPKPSLMETPAAPLPVMPELDPSAPVDAVTMEAHMRKMVETMRFFQQKDPSTFHNVWQSVKKESSTRPAITESGERQQGTVPQAQTTTPTLSAARTATPGAPQVATIPRSTGAAVPETERSGGNRSKPKNSGKKRLQEASPALPGPVSSVQPKPHQDSPPALAPQQHPSPPTAPAPSFSAAPSQEPSRDSQSKQHFQQMAIAVKEYFDTLGIAIDTDVLAKFLPTTHQFVRLCQYFENLGYKFDRAHFAKHLLTLTKKPTPATTNRNNQTVASPQPLLPPKSQGASQQALHPRSTSTLNPPTQNILPNVKSRPDGQTVQTGGRVLGEVDDVQEQLMNESHMGTNEPMGSDFSQSHPPRTDSPKMAIHEQPVYGVPRAESSNRPANSSTTKPNPRERPGTEGWPPQGVQKGSPSSLIVKLPFKGTLDQQRPSNEQMNGPMPHPPPQPRFHPQPGSSVFGPHPQPRPIAFSPQGPPPHGHVHPPGPYHFRPYVPSGNMQHPIVLVDSPSATPPMQPHWQTPINLQGAREGAVSLRGPPIPQFGPPYPHPYVVAGMGPRFGFPPAGALENGPSPFIDLTKENSKQQSSITLPPRKKIPDPKAPLAEPLRREKAKRCSRYSSNNIARNILIVIGKHPTERPLNDHLRPLRENLLGQVSLETDLSTINWDVLDPKPSPEAKPVPVKSAGMGDQMGDEAVPSTPNGVGPGSPSATKSDKKRGHPGAASTVQAPGSRVSRNGNTTSDPRRLSTSTTDHNDMSSPHPSKRRRTGDASSSSSSLNPVARTPGSAAPLFKEYRCLWHTCTACLHNWDTLQRHVTKVHKRGLPNGKYPCHWDVCVNHTLTMTEAEWDAHMAQHMDVVKNVLGLGPAVTPSGSSILPASTPLPKGGTRISLNSTYSSAPLSHTDSTLPANTKVNFLIDPRTGQQITPLAGPAPEGFQFETPPGHKANRLWNETHDVPSAKRRKEAQKEAEYQKWLERGRKLGAGIQGDPWEGRWELGDGLGAQDATVKIVDANWP
ncbi:hypothetical protein EX30DRAFT_363262 [Ascodesmis nigricans]|uniref:C2H2-type domain-containing protein n=1 Tax=Ascodesmis nigricans TaxID=341454 RepID=A0A4S2MZT8_9PEZI|nr:hypothetical protein EX30DRAFT_363262 [Ascodesmis nigricans]